MLKIRVWIILFLITSTTIAQDNKTWQSIMDRYIALQLNGDPEFEAFMVLDELQEALRKDFNHEKQDYLMSYLLATSNDGELSNADGPIFKRVSQALEKLPFQKALFLMEHANLTDTDTNTSLREIEAALELFRQARREVSSVYIHAVMDYGSALLKQKKFKAAFDQYEKARQQAEKTTGKSTTLYTDILKRIADYYFSVGDLEQATQLRESAYQIEADALGINQPYLEIFSVNFLSRESLIKDDFRLPYFVDYTAVDIYRKSMASLLYDESLKRVKKNGIQDLPDAVAVLHKAKADLNHDNFETAISGFTLAADFFAQKSLAGENLVNYARSLNYLACSQYRAKDYKAALKNFETLHQRLSAVPQWAQWTKKVIHNLILAHEQVGNQEALHKLLVPFTSPQESTSIELDSKEYMTRYGDILFNQGDYKSALVVYTRAYDQYWSEKETDYYLIQEQQSQQGDDGVGDEFGYSSDEVAEDNVLLTFGPSDAVREIHPYKPVGWHYTRLLYKLAHTAFLTGNWADAGKYITTYINEFYTELENGHYHQNRGSDLYEIYRLQQELFPAYDLFQNIVLMDTLSDNDLLKEHKMRAYAHILDSKANIQYEYRHMRKTIETGDNKELKSAYAKYVLQRQQLANLKLSADSQTDSIDNLMVSIDTLKAFLSNKTGLLSPPSKDFVFWTDIKKRLKRNEAAVEIKRFNRYTAGKWTNEPIYAAYIITPLSEYPEVVYFPDGSFLEGRAFKRYQNMMKLKLEDTVSYNVYWKPIEQALTGVSKVFLAGDGVFSQINVQALYNNTTGKFMMDTQKVYHLVSTKDLNEVKNFRQKIKKATLMGRPAYYIPGAKTNTRIEPDETDGLRAITRAQIASGEISDLPATEKEIMDIGRILKTNGVPTQHFIGQHATEEAFKNSGADIMHIATHGFWFKEHAQLDKQDAMLNSGLLFAGVKNFYNGSASGMTDDGILTAYEVQGMNLSDTQLAVLSACETALGSVEVNEGVYGLQRAFRIAGADKIIMSLWKVDDEATQQLFSTFYNNWLNKKADIAEAFDQAIHEIKLKYRHPYYWGAFILME